MNNKYVKYFLIFTVAGVWAAIIYRIVHGLSGPAVARMAPARVPAEVMRPNEDTFHLYADYPDPFLPEEDAGKADSIAKKAAVTPGTPAGMGTVPPAPPLTAEMVAGIVQYNGIISNPGKKTKVGIITIRGKEYLVRENDRIGDVRVRRIEKNKIWVLYKGEPFVLGK